MPTIEFLKKYHLMQFAEVTKAVRQSPSIKQSSDEAQDLFYSL